MWTRGLTRTIRSHRPIVRPVLLDEFVLTQLPPAPIRVLEVGCGSGELARGLDAAGHEVVAIDPKAPNGEIFRRTSLAEFGACEPFHAVVASRSLHHIGDLAAALDQIVDLLRAEGVIVVYEHAPDRLDEDTARWLLGHSENAPPDAPRTLTPFLDWWKDAHAGLHDYGAIRAELDQRFSERVFTWTPYLYGELGGAVDPAEEMQLIETGAIKATGFRYVGRRATRPTR